MRLRTANTRRKRLLARRMSPFYQFWADLGNFREMVYNVYMHGIPGGPPGLLDGAVGTPQGVFYGRD